LGKARLRRYSGRGTTSRSRQHLPEPSLLLLLLLLLLAAE